MIIDDHTHSPEIPIPVHVASTPANYMSNPPSSPPEVMANPIDLFGPLSTPANSISNPLSSPTEVTTSPIGPPARFKDIVIRKFGSRLTLVTAGNLFCKPAVN